MRGRSATDWAWHFYANTKVVPAILLRIVVRHSADSTHPIAEVTSWQNDASVDMS